MINIINVANKRFFESLLGNGFIKNRITDNENENYMENHYCL